MSSHASKHSTDSFFIQTIGEAIEQKCETLIKAAGRPRMMSSRRARAYLDLGETQFRELAKSGALGVPVTYSDAPNAQQYFEIEKLDAFIESRKQRSKVA